MKYYDIFAQYISNVLPDKEEQLVRCVFHDDTNPSLSINIEKGLFYCHACRVGGDINDFLRLVGAKIDVQYIENDAKRFHENMLANSKVLSFLINTRFISLEVIKQRLIGYDELTGRYTIPVTNKEGRIVGIRKYKPYALTGKIIAYGENELCYPFDVLINENAITITEGELDCLALNSNGIPAITLLPPSAVSNVDLLAEFLKDKIINIVYDSDSTGRKLANDLVKKIAVYNTAIKKVDISPYKDVTDFLANRSSSDLINLIYATRFINETQEEDLDYPYVDIGDLVAVENLGKTFKCDFYTMSRTISCFALPYSYTVVCPANFDFCSKCMLKSFGGSYDDTMTKDMITEIDLYHGNVIEKMIEKRYGIPKRCTYFRVNPIKSKLITLVNASPKIGDATSIREGYAQVKMYVVSDNDVIQMNGNYSGIVYVTSSARNNEVVGVTERCEPINQFVQYELLPTMFKFNPEENQTVFEKIFDISKDLEYITAVNERIPLIMAIDLVFHSALNIHFDRKKIKGYLDILVIGDTRTGKSSVAKELVRFYKLGDIVDGSTTTIAGLIGGIGRYEENMYLVWGALPQNDGRLVIIDEADELSKEILERLSYVRSSGIAELTKIYKSRTNARVRLIMITNPISGVKMKDYSYPILAIKDFAKSRQDIARFDYCVTVSHDVSTIKVEERGIKHDVDAYYNLVRFAWNLSPEDIIYTFTMDELLDMCDKISSDYSDDVPLIERNSLYEKVLRISTAAAIRTFNYDEKMRKIVVDKRYLQFARDFLDFIYKDENNMYYQYSQAIKLEETSYDLNDIMSGISLINKPEAFLKKAMVYTVFSKTELYDIISASKEEFEEIFSILIRNNLIRRLSSGYYTKTELFGRVADMITKKLEEKK